MTDTPSPPASNADQTALLNLLTAISDEMYELVCEIVRLGEALSAEELAGGKSQRISDMQAFDLLAQSALAQSRLIKGVERGLAEGSSDAMKNIVRMIEDVPFHKIRKRLYIAFTGKEKPESLDLPWEEAGDLDWF